MHWAANRPVICRKSLTRAGDLPYVRLHACHGGSREKKACRTRGLASSLGRKCSVSGWCGARRQDYESAVTQAAKGACDDGSRAKARTGSTAVRRPRGRYARHAPRGHLWEAARLSRRACSERKLLNVLKQTTLTSGSVPATADRMEADHVKVIIIIKDRRDT